MRIFLVMDETCFFHPQFLQRLLRQTPDEIVGACLVTGIRKKNNIERYMMTHFYYLKISEIVKLGYKKIKYLLLDTLDKNKDYTVKSVLVRNQIRFKEVKYNINTKENLDYIKAFHPDIILSSQSLYFGRKLLGLPALGCINRHSGLLPRNGGLWPVFQAVRKGEKETGVSVHVMTSKIDDGKVLSQKKTPVRKGDTLWSLYDRCFTLSVDAVLEALEKIRRGDLTAVENGYPKEYYSFPDKDHWRDFRRHKGRYI